MRVSGEHIVAGSREKVFQTLLDPDILLRCIPGCEEMVKSGDGVFATRLKAGLGPIKGVFTGEVVLKDVNPPEGYVMELSGKGKMGFLKGRTRITLRSAGENRTEIVYESDLQVGGLIASVGSRFIPAAARDFSKQFFSVLEEALSS